ncbi:MAG: class I adenylate-forming enzyme family protein [Acidimicrobiales bacterium]
MQNLQPTGSVAEVFDRVLAVDPDREALVTASGRWSYAELDVMADRAAEALISLGVGRGDRVAAALPNDLDLVAAFHGAMRLGAVWVGVNRALAPPEQAFVLSDSACSVLLADAVTLSELEPHRRALPELSHTVKVGKGWAAALEPSSDRRSLADLDPTAPAAIAYTSGTTGHPKGAVLSQYNLLMPGAAVVASRGYGPELRKADCLPLTILNMLVLTTLLVAQAGGSCIVMDRVDAQGVADWIERERVTTWNGVPAQLYSLVNDDSIGPEALASLEELWVGGADCPESLREAVAAKFGTPVVHTYGLTEAPTIVSMDDRPVPGGADSHRRGASGRPLPHLRVRILDEEGRELGPGESGEVCLAPVQEGPWSGAYRPPRGYWHRPEATAELLRGGVVHTGDVGFLDGDGFLYLRDRRNQMILRGGANVYPAEVERVLLARPGVVAAAVAGVPDERLGQRVMAAIQVEPGVQVSSEDLTGHCLGQLARYKVPERFVFVEDFARNSMGKIDRKALYDLFPDH